MNLKITYGANLHSAALVELGLWRARLSDRAWTFSKGGQLLAVLAGITTLIYGTCFGVTHVLPTLVSGTLATGAIALPMALGTTVLCFLALANAIGKQGISANPSEWPELEEGDLGLIALMTLPGLPGAFLAGGTTANAMGPGGAGTVLGLAVVLAAVAAITFTAVVAADPEPVLSRSLFTKKNRSDALA